MKRILLILFAIILTNKIYSAPTHVYSVLGADGIYITDTAGYFSSATVEGALVELYERTPSSITISSTYLSISSATASYLTISLAESLYLTISSAQNTYVTKSSASVTYLHADQAVDIGAYDMTATAFHGDGSALTGIVSGIDVSDGGSLIVDDSTATTYGNFFNVTKYGTSLSSITLDLAALKANIDTDTDTDTDTRTADIYKVRIGSWAGPGITHVCDGVDDQTQFMQAAVKAGSKGVVWVDPTMTYVFSSSTTIGISSVSFISNGALLTLKPGMLYTSNEFFITLTTATDISWKGFTFDGTGTTTSGNYLDLYGARWSVIDCIFQNVPATSNAMCIRANGNYGTLQDSQFKNVLVMPFLNYGNNCVYKNLLIGAGCANAEIRGSNNSARCNDFYCTSLLIGAAYYTLIEDNMFQNNTGPYALELRGTDTLFQGNIIDNPTGYGARVFSGAYRNIIQGNTFRQVGGTGDNADGLLLESLDCVVTSNIFTGNMDRYAISIAATAKNTIIGYQNFNYVTGHIAHISNLGVNTTISNCLPQSVNNSYMTFYSSTTAGLNGTTPSKVGESYWNTDTNELWIASGTLKNQFTHK